MYSNCDYSHFACTECLTDITTSAMNEYANGTTRCEYWCAACTVWRQPDEIVDTDYKYADPYA